MITNERKIEMFPALLKDSIRAYIEGSGDNWGEIYIILERYGFEEFEIYEILDCIMGEYAGLNIEDYKGKNYGYFIPMNDGSTLFIEPTTDGEDWHACIEDENDELVFDSYVQMFDWERESENDFNISRLIDVFELAEPNENGYTIEDLADYSFRI